MGSGSITLPVSLCPCRVLQGDHRPVGEVHEPDVHKDIRKAVHPEHPCVPRTVCRTSQILFCLVELFFCSQSYSIEYRSVDAPLYSVYTLGCHYRRGEEDLVLFVNTMKKGSWRKTKRIENLWLPDSLFHIPVILFGLCGSDLAGPGMVCVCLCVYHLILCGKALAVRFVCMLETVDGDNCLFRIRLPVERPTGIPVIYSGRIRE